MSPTAHDALLRLRDAADDLLDLDRAGPVARSRGMTGQGLVETEPGAWATAQMAALAEERDTVHLRELELDALRR